METLPLCMSNIDRQYWYEKSQEIPCNWILNECVTGNNHKNRYVIWVEKSTNKTKNTEKVE